MGFETNIIIPHRGYGGQDFRSVTTYWSKGRRHITQKPGWQSRLRWVKNFGLGCHKSGKERKDRSSLEGMKLFDTIPYSWSGSVWDVKGLRRLCWHSFIYCRTGTKAIQAPSDHAFPRYWSGYNWFPPFIHQDSLFCLPTIRTVPLIFTESGGIRSRYSYNNFPARLYFVRTTTWYSIQSLSQQWHKAQSDAHLLLQSPSPATWKVRPTLKTEVKLRRAALSEEMINLWFVGEKARRSRQGGAGGFIPWGGCPWTIRSKDTSKNRSV